MRASNTGIPQKIKTKCDKPKKFTEEEVKKILIQMSKPIVISDPFPRTLDLIFTKKKINRIKNKI